MVYDASQNLISFTTQRWTGTGWRNSSLYSATFDEQNNLKTELKQISFDGLTLENYWQKSYTYDDNNNLTCITEIHGEQNYQQYTAEYDLQNNQISETWKGWNGYEWANDHRYLYIYDERNNITERLTQYSYAGSWSDSFKENYTFNENNRCISGLAYNWTGVIWENVGRFIFTYNEGNMLDNELYQDMVEGEWYNSYQIIYSYNENNLLVDQLVQTGNIGEWKNAYQDTYEYDFNNSKKNDVYKYWIYPAIEIPVIVHGDSTNYYYHTTITGLSVHEDENVVVYPNPSNEKINH